MKRTFLSFRAEGILGNICYHLDIDNDATILIGPNGSGKSTFLNVFYLFVTRQWPRLVEYEFSKLTLEIEGDTISVSKTDLFGMDALSKFSPRIRTYISRLVETQNLQNFLSTKSLTLGESAEIASLLKLPREEIRPLRSYLQNQTKDLFDSSFIDAEQKLADLKLDKVLYLPTYRRIERDLKSIIPDIEERLRSRLQESQTYGRQGQNFAEIVSFGMDDIRRIILDFTTKLNIASKNKSNAAAQEYIRDMVRGQIANYSIGPIRDINPESISQFVDRLDDQLLSLEDKSRLRNDIEKLRKKGAGKPTKNMQYLGFFVEKMLNVYLDLQKEEAPFVQFTNIVKKYFSNKSVQYKNYSFVITDINGNEISLDDLSSGEKQIISIFAYLLLSKEQSYLVFIDEPELSLSVPWQKTFLPDIVDTARCSYLFAVSHSPFTFDNYLRESIVDVRKLNRG